MLLTSPHASPNDAGRAHLILVGLPGAGKSTVGPLLAERLGRPFLDLDREIERREGESVAGIFASRGESHFRSLEQALTLELRDYGGLVLAPGGGWMCDSGAVQALRPPSRIYYLKVRPAIALARLKQDPGVRPLLTGPEPLATLERLLSERAAAYETADHVVDTEAFDLQELTDQLVMLAPNSGAR
jgi:shikimate kinase